MNCEEIDDLIAGYAIAAVTDVESAEVRRHLAGCRRHDEALASFRNVADQLALAVDEREAPGALRQRLLRAFDEEATRRGPAAAQRLGGRFLPRPAYALAAAAVLVLAVAGLTVWNLTLQLGDDASTISAELAGLGPGNRLIYLKDEDVVVVTLNMAPPGADRVYQAWGIYDAAPVSLGLLPNEGTIAIDADLSGASAFAITDEPAGGSEQPTSEPLAIAQLD